LNAPVAQLSIRHPDGREELSTLCAGSVVRVGRQTGNDLVLIDKRVSRFHAVLNTSTAGVVLSDLQSLNGTFVNGRRISVPVDLRSGDAILIGDTSFHVEIIFEAGERSPGGRSDASTVTQSIGMRSLGVTVLIGDVAGYTRLAQEYPTAVVAAMLERWFELSTSTVREMGGEVDKYLGDAFMAIWRPDEEAGGAQGGENIPAQLAGKAVHAAQLILRNTARLNNPQHWPHCGEHPWRCRLSLNSGEALVGALGNRAMRDFTVLGDTVNVAFRLNDAAKQLGCEILLSSSTAALVGSEFPLLSKGAVQLEGREGLEKVFSL
jgi:adenylate cyclase